MAAKHSTKMKLEGEYGVRLYSNMPDKFRKKIDPIRRTRPPVDVKKIAKVLHLTVIEKILPSGTSAAIKKEGDAIFLYYESTESKARQRFAIAHEIAHWLLGHLEQEHYLSENRLLRSNRLSNIQERDANYLAAELLMPMSTIDRLMEKHKNHKEPYTIIELARELGVSEQALRIRLGIP